MAGARRLLCLWLGCFCVSLAQGERLKQHFVELRKAMPGDRTAGGGPSPVLQPHDKVSEHMLRLYDRYRAAAGGPRRCGHQGPLSEAHSLCAPGPCEKATQFAAFEPERQVSVRGAPLPVVLPQTPRSFLIYLIIPYSAS